MSQEDSGPLGGSQVPEHQDPLDGPGDGVRSVVAQRGRAELLEELFDATSDLIQVLGVDGRLRLVNRAWCERLGYSEQEAIGLNVFELIAPDCQEHCRQLFHTLLTGHGSQRIECAFISRHGRRLSLEGEVYVVLVGGAPAEVRGIFRDVSERKEVETALQELNASLEARVQERTRELMITQARLEEAQRLASIGHWEMNLVSGALHWSDEICRICGFDPHTVNPSYELFLRTVHPEDRELLESCYRQSQAVGEPCEHRYRLLLQDGSTRYIHARWTTDLDGDGRPVRSIGTSQDVTEFELAQRNLREGEAKLRSLFEASPLGLVMIEDGERFVLANPAFSRISGLVPEVLEALPISSSLPPPLHDLAECCRAVLSGQPSAVSLRQWPLGNGRAAVVQLQASAVKAYPNAARASLVLVQVEDISDRLAAEESMRLAAKVFHSAAEGIFLTDPNGVIVDVNEALTRITGFGRAELLGQNPRVFKSGFHSAEFYQEIWAALDDDGVWSGEIVNRASDGSLQDLLETISVVRDDQGVITHYVAMLSDIRQLKKQQRQLERMALYDALTGLPNRVLLAERMAQSMARARRGAGAIAICYLDLDGFKQINDLHGHSAGDSLLQTVGQRMQAVLPPSDVVARLGGDEFVIVLHGIQAGPEEYELVQRLLDALVEPIVWNDLILQISASVGIAYFGDHLATLQADELLKLADQAMYEAKRHGKNRYWVSPQAPKLQRAD